jgi:lipid-binding SYLF domain-containing protein
MRIAHLLTLLLVTVFATFTVGGAAAQRSDSVKLQQAARVMEIFSSDEEHGIPTEVLQRARGIVVIPNLIRGGFLFGGRRGRGVMAVRTANGEWSNPAFVTLTGGSFGAQFGAETADVVLVFANDRSVRNISSGKFTLGGDAAAVAGPLGRRSTAAVTGRAEIYVYMHSKGLFAGAAFEGTRLDVDQDASAAFYLNSGAKALGEQNTGTPGSVLPFLESLRRAAVLAGPPGAPQPGAQPQPAAPNEEAVTFPIGDAPAQ